MYATTAIMRPCCWPGSWMHAVVVERARARKGWGIGKCDDTHSWIRQEGRRVPFRSGFGTSWGRSLDDVLTRLNECEKNKVNDVPVAGLTRVGSGCDRRGMAWEDC